MYVLVVLLAVDHFLEILPACEIPSPCDVTLCEPARTTNKQISAQDRLFELALLSNWRSVTTSH
jgi:hypothetical protein